MGIGDGTFSIQVPDSAKAGDTYTIKGLDSAGFKGATRDLVDSDGNVIATTKMAPDGDSITFTYTKYVDTHTGITATYKQTYNYANHRVDGGFKAGKTYNPTWVGCENGIKKTQSFTITDVISSRGLATAWDDQGKSTIVFVQDAPSVGADNTRLTYTMELDRPGAKFVEDQIKNLVESQGIGYAIRDGEKITDLKPAKLVTGTPKAGEYRIVEFSDRKFAVEIVIPKKGQSFHAEFHTVSDGTEGWKKLGRTPFTFDYSLDYGNKKRDFSTKPPRPFADGTGDGDLKEVKPALTKTWDATKKQFVLTVTNPSKDGVVMPGKYSDALYETSGALSKTQLKLGKPSVGTVKNGVWSVPMLAPGEKATMTIAYADDGKGKVNRFGKDKSPCVTGELVDKEVGPTCAEAEVPKNKPKPKPEEPTEEPTPETPAEPAVLDVNPREQDTRFVKDGNPVTVTKCTPGEKVKFVVTKRGDDSVKPFEQTIVADENGEAGFPVRGLNKDNPSVYRGWYDVVATCGDHEMKGEFEIWGEKVEEPTEKPEAPVEKPDTPEEVVADEPTKGSLPRTGPNGALAAGIAGAILLTVGGATIYLSRRRVAQK